MDSSFSLTHIYHTASSYLVCGLTSWGETEVGEGEMTVLHGETGIWQRSLLNCGRKSGAHAC